MHACIYTYQNQILYNISTLMMFSWVCLQLSAVQVPVSWIGPLHLWKWRHLCKWQPFATPLSNGEGDSAPPWHGSVQRWWCKWAQRGSTPAILPWNVYLFGITWFSWRLSCESLCHLLVTMYWSWNTLVRKNYHKHCLLLQTCQEHECIAIMWPCCSVNIGRRFQAPCLFLPLSEHLILK